MDKLIWDVGHQAYAHKILTGRHAKFNSIRQKGGLSGFPKMSESEFDSFGTGHSSTSLSAILGIATAAKLDNKLSQHIAVIGDGALTEEWLSRHSITLLQVAQMFYLSLMTTTCQSMIM